MKYLITGGSGFIGSALVKTLLKNKQNQILNIDKLTYAHNKHALNSIKERQNYSFYKTDINDQKKIKNIIFKFKPDIIFNLAAESHVDRSIVNSKKFIKTNINGTFTLLELSNEYFQTISKNNRSKFKFIQISTDEVFGSLKKGSKSFIENSNFLPNSPYAASKASADHLVRSFYKTYNLPILITHCSNNYGPFQNSEKLIPKTIINAIRKKPIPVYGDGKQMRDWIHVQDHVDALVLISTKGKIGESYNIGSKNVRQNIYIIKSICKILNKINSSNKKIDYQSLITKVKDRLGHDFKYSVNANKIMNDLKWNPKKRFNKELFNTVLWYKNNLTKTK